MKILLITVISLFSTTLSAQSDSCKIYRESFAKISTNLPANTSGQPYLARFDVVKLSNIRSLPGYHRATSIIDWLQTTLNGYNQSYVDKEYWRLTHFDDTYKMMDILRKECPTINLAVFEAEMAFYESEYRSVDQTKHRDDK